MIEGALRSRYGSRGVATRLRLSLVRSDETEQQRNTQHNHSHHSDNSPNRTGPPTLPLQQPPQAASRTLYRITGGGGGAESFQNSYVETTTRNHTTRTYKKQHPLAIVDLDPDTDPPEVLAIGPDSAGNLHETIWLEPAEQVELVIHTMELRPLFYDLLATGKDPTP